MSDETLKYSFTVEWSDEDESFVALCPEFPGLSAFGDTREEAVREGLVALGLMVEVVKEAGEPLPEPRKLIFGKAKAERAVLTAAVAWRKADLAMMAARDQPLGDDPAATMEAECASEAREAEAFAALRKAVDELRKGGEG